MKIILIIFVFFYSSTYAFSQNTANNDIYSGGMLVFQPGYIITGNEHQNIESLTFGLGGIFRFYFYKNFTAGIFGGTQRTKYSSTNSDNSYINLGYGGPTLGYTKKYGKLRYTASAFFGKGSVSNLHIENQHDNILTESYLYTNSTIVFSPILSVDYALTSKLMLTVQTVCLSAKYDDDKSLFIPAIQVGVLFNR